MADDLETRKHLLDALTAARDAYNAGAGQDGDRAEIQIIAGGKSAE